MSYRLSFVAMFVGAVAAMVRVPVASAKIASSTHACLSAQRCQTVSNGTVAVTVTLDVGPRILAYGFVGQDNVFAEMPPPEGAAKDLKKFQVWGGQRLWHAPEVRARTYEADNEPVALEVLAPGRLRLTARPEAKTGLQKQIDLTVAGTGTQVVVRHALKNQGVFAVEVAPWAIAIMKGGGTAIIPQEPPRPHAEALQPVRSSALWSYTDLSDPRFLLGPKLWRLHTDASRRTPQKIGVANRQGWVGYHRARTLFVKRVAYDGTAVYPDFGSNVEVFTTGDFIEVETLGPLVRVEPGAEAVHVETWFLFGGVELPADDAAAAAALEPLIAKTSGSGARKEGRGP